MFAWPDTEHYLPICEYSGYGIYASRESFAKKNHIWANAFMLHAQHLPGSTKTLTELEHSA
jgi:hypothetical protein